MATVAPVPKTMATIQGNDLRNAGLTGGCKWCLCSARWKEAYDAFKDGIIGRDAVPKVDLRATEDTALKTVTIQELEEFAAGK